MTATRGTVFTQLRPVEESDRGWVREILRASWGDTQVISRGRSHQADQLPGFIALQGEHQLGVITYRIDVGGEGSPPECEVVTLNSLTEGQGIGSALLEAVIQSAREAGCRRVWLITTNDNLPALGFYQKRGFVLAALHRDALKEYRRLKPSIPETGLGGIPLRDEIELEFLLTSTNPAGKISPD